MYSGHSACQANYHLPSHNKPNCHNTLVIELNWELSQMITSHQTWYFCRLVLVKKNMTSAIHIHCKLARHATDMPCPSCCKERFGLMSSFPGSGDFLELSENDITCWPACCQVSLQPADVDLCCKSSGTSLVILCVFKWSSCVKLVKGKLPL